MFNNRWARKLVWFVFLYTFGVLLFVFRGVSVDLSPWSQMVVNGLVKYWYPDKEREETTVVLFREENLEQLNETYPVSYKTHAEILQALLTYSPRAVFVDFVFLDKRRDPTGLEALQKAICGFAQAGIPLYLAVPSADKIRPELHPNAGTTCEGLSEAKLVSAQMEPADGSSGVLKYELKDSPAWPMAMLRYEVKSSFGEKATYPQERMEIIWPSGPTLPINEWMRCEPDSWFSEIQKILYEGPLSKKLECPYTPTVSVRHVLNSIGDRDVTRALEKRSVFYGAGFHAAGDILTSPVYAELPAVYLHAMAHDNLLTLKDNYKRAERDKIFSISRRFDYVLLLFMVGILLFLDKFNGWLTTKFLYSSRYISVIRSERYTWLYVVGLKRRETKLIYGSKWLPLRLAVIWLVIAALLGRAWSGWDLWNAFLWSTIFGVSLLVGVFALGHLNISVAPNRNVSEDFQELRKQLATLVGPLLLGGVFLILYTLLEIEAALLVSLVVYFFYKLFFAKDLYAVITAILLVIASLISFWPFNLGPRNIIAYLIFFEVAQHLIQHAAEVAEKYRSLRARDPTMDAGWPWWGREWRFNPLQLFCELCDREVQNANREDHSACRDAGYDAAHGDDRVGAGKGSAGEDNKASDSKLVRL